MLTVGIEEKLADWPIDLPGASLLSLMLIAVALGGWALQRKLTGGTDVTSVSGKPAAHVGAKLGLFTAPVVAVMAMIGFIAVVLPGLSMAVTGFSATLSGGLAWDNLTGAHFAALFAQRGDALPALGTSVSLAFAAALITGLLGLCAAWLVVMQRIKGARLSMRCRLCRRAAGGWWSGSG